MTIRCKIGMHTWIKRATITVEQFPLIGKADSSSFDMCRCFYCGEWNIHPAVFGISLDKHGDIEPRLNVWIDFKEDEEPPTPAHTHN
jgi:hypothetical protein